MEDAMNDESSLHLHDAELVGVRHRRDSRTLALSIACASGEDAELTFEGVRQFRLVDYGTQNVALRATLTPDPALDESEITRWVNWVFTTVDGESWLSAEKRESLLRAVASGSLLLPVWIPSQGAQVGVIAE
jgi:hypothetical protein